MRRGRKRKAGKTTGSGGSRATVDSPHETRSQTKAMWTLLNVTQVPGVGETFAECRTSTGVGQPDFPHMVATLFMLAPRQRGLSAAILWMSSNVRCAILRRREVGPTLLTVVTLPMLAPHLFGVQRRARTPAVLVSRTWTEVQRWRDHASRAGTGL